MHICPWVGIRRRGCEVCRFADCIQASTVAEGTCPRVASNARGSVGLPAHCRRRLCEVCPSRHEQAGEWF